MDSHEDGNGDVCEKPKDTKENNQLASLDIATVPKATEMLDCVVWDPANKRKENPSMSICSIPMEAECSGVFRQGYYDCFDLLCIFEVFEFE